MWRKQNDVFFCLAVNMLEIADLKDVLERAEKNAGDMSQPEKADFIKRQPLILDVLAEIDIEAAYRLLENEEMPGWLFMPKNGATTVWESWEGTEAQGGIASLNHYSKGAVCAWLFKTMCGIRIAEENHFVIAPRKGGVSERLRFGHQRLGEDGRRLCFHSHDPGEYYCGTHSPRWRTTRDHGGHAYIYLVNIEMEDPPIFRGIFAYSKKLRTSLKVSSRFWRARLGRCSRWLGSVLCRLVVIAGPE